MPTLGQSQMLRSTVNLYISIAFIVTFTIGCALVLWHAAYGNNPVADFIASSKISQENGY